MRKIVNTTHFILACVLLMCVCDARAMLRGGGGKKIRKRSINHSTSSSGVDLGLKVESNTKSIEYVGKELHALKEDLPIEYVSQVQYKTEKEIAEWALSNSISGVQSMIDKFQSVIDKKDEEIFNIHRKQRTLNESLDSVISVNVRNRRLIEALKCCVVDDIVSYIIENREALKALNSVSVDNTKKIESLLCRVKELEDLDLVSAETYKQEMGTLAGRIGILSCNQLSVRKYQGHQADKMKILDQKVNRVSGVLGRAIINQKKELEQKIAEQQSTDEQLINAITDQKKADFDRQYQETERRLFKLIESLNISFKAVEDKIVNVDGRLKSIEATVEEFVTDVKSIKKEQEEKKQTAQIEAEKKRKSGWW